jgi:uncharacterized protein YndB with AHSA1/START domain
VTTTPEVGTTVFATPSEREVVVTRVVNAPRQLVWDVHTKCDHVPNWMLGAEGWTMPGCEIELRPGGAWRFVWRRPNGIEIALNGVYQVVSPPERLVYTESWGGDWADSINTMILTESNGKTTIAMTILYPSLAARDATLNTGMKDGMAQSLERLSDYLNQLGTRAAE